MQQKANVPLRSGTCSLLYVLLRGQMKKKHHKQTQAADEREKN